MHKEKFILQSTHVDAHNTVFLKSALESSLKYLNGKRKPRLGIDHIRTFPPLGILTNGEVKEGQDGHFYLIAENYYFDKREIIKLDDETILLSEFFSEHEFPFVECEDEITEKIQISIDPSNFSHYSEIDTFFSDLHEINSDVENATHGRKSLIPDPEIIISIPTAIGVALGLGAKKLTEKIGEEVGNDLVKFYKLLKKIAVESLKKTIPKYRPNNFVIIFPNKKYIIELVITTTKADDVLEALNKDKLKTINEKIELLNKLSPEKLQFVYENEQWNFNYLLSNTGKVIGLEKSFKHRDETFVNLLKKQKGSS